MDNWDHTGKPIENVTEKSLIPYPFGILLLGKTVQTDLQKFIRDELWSSPSSAHFFLYKVISQGP